MRGGNRHWVKKSTLVESRANVTDVKFGPPHLGLVLATCAANGVLRIYECHDIMALGTWNIQHEMQTGHPRAACLAWNTSKYHPPLIAVGCDQPTPAGGQEPATSKVALFERLPNQSKWARVEPFRFAEPVFDLQFAPNIGRSTHRLAVASRFAHIFQLKPVR